LDGLRGLRARFSRTKRGPRRRWAPCLLLSLVAGPSLPATPAGHSAAEVRADQQFTTYAYAHEFGSGVYDFDGRTLQVYTLPFGWWARHADEHGPGVHLELPVTLGFLDFQATDVISTGLPVSVDSVSFVPGIELEFRLSPAWTLLPYVQAGASVADAEDVETRLFGTGLRVEHTFAMNAFQGAYAGEFVYSTVRYVGELPDDDFVRWRNGIELRRGTGYNLAGRELELGIFSSVDAYVDPPTGPTTGVDVPEVQLEAGVILGTHPELKVWRLPLPRLGISYRFAGDLSGIRFVIGAPF
jgi:hypothetical protein